MDSFLNPLRAELERRARLSYKIWLHLASRLEEARRSDPNGEAKIDDDIDPDWKLSLRRESELCEGDLDYPQVSTQFGVRLSDKIIFTLFRRERLDAEPREEDITPAACFHIAENGVVYETGSPGEYDNNMLYTSSSRELNSDELEGFWNDVQRMFPV